MKPNFNTHQPVSEYEEKVIQVNRVSKKTKGGNTIGFSVLVVVGDKKGSVGVGLGKGKDVISSIKKASRRAKKRMIKLPLQKGTIPFPIEIKRGAAKLILKPAPEGSGVIAGGAVRAVVEAAGVTNIVSKILGSNNQASNVYATFSALNKIRQLTKLKNIKLSPASPQKPNQTLKPQSSIKPTTRPISSSKPITNLSQPVSSRK